MILKLQKAKWDEWAIRAELRRRGFRFKAMAEESGFSASTLRGALNKPSTNVNRYIAMILGVSTHELWPDWFDSDGELIPAKYRRKLTALRGSSASHESRAA
jgi:Ner family transcriptional regulator